jgi:5-(aminomethyl)-3-furanmethanol phosphate kinase
MTQPSESITVIKIGGGLTWVPGALDRVCLTVGSLSRERRLVVVPGAGPFADVVREFDRRVGLSPDVAHWMAILGMDQYAHVLASRIPDAVLVEEPGCVREALAAGAVVLAPSRWMRSADVLPHSWDVTSDSIAAFVAGALDARRLILIKPDSAAAEPVDPYFFTTLPSGLSHSIIGADRIEDLAEELSR